jgi:hypothetical protein
MNKKISTQIELETLGNFLINYSSDLSYIRAFQNWKLSGYKETNYFDNEEFSLKNFLIEFNLLRFFKKEIHNDLFEKITKYFIQNKEINVDNLAVCLSEKKKISMASKILFLHSPEKIIIYDKFAKLGVNYKGNSYEEFILNVGVYSKEYQESIKKLTKQIPKSLYDIEKEILTVSSYKIRQNRLIDKLFWTIGKNKEKQKNMTKEQIKQICQASIDIITITAKQTSIENLNKIINELELNPEEFIFNDVNLMRKIFKEELELKLK